MASNHALAKSLPPQWTFEALEGRVMLAATPASAPIPTLSAPTGLHATPDVYRGVDLTWNAVPNAYYYAVYGAPTGTGKFSIVGYGFPPESSGNYYVTPLQRTDFRVVAVGESTSPPSKIATATVPLDPPGNFAESSVTASQINLTWDSANEKITSVDIRRSTDGIHFKSITVVPAGVYRYSDKNLKDGTDYFYEARAHSGSAVSAFSFPWDTLTLPLAPSSLSAAALNTSQISLSWKNRSTTADGITIFRSDDGGATFQQVMLQGNPMPPTATSFVDSGLAPGHIYRYYVKSSVNPPPPQTPVGVILDPIYSVPSNTVSPSTPRASVTGLSAVTVSTREIDLSWTVSIKDATAIQIIRSTDGRNFKPLATLSHNASHFKNTGLSPNTHYWYEVRAIRRYASTAYSPTDTFTLPSAPTQLRAILTGLKGIHLTWKSGNPLPISFNIERSDAGQNNYYSIGFSDSTSFDDTFGSPGASYQYRVEAVNFYMWRYTSSAPSNTITATEVLPWPG